MEFVLTKDLPTAIGLEELTRVIREFYVDAKIQTEWDGFLQTNLERFSGATILKNPSWDLWLAIDKNQIKTWVLASLDKGPDGKFCYLIHSAWVDKEFRNTGFSYSCWEKLKERAKQLFCKQIFVYSVRSFKAYKRFFRGNLTKQCEVLRMELE